MADDQKTGRHRRAQTATERDLQGIRAAKERAASASARVRCDAPADGVPLLPDDEAFTREFTPVADVLEGITSPELRNAIAKLWRHTANIELRARERAVEEGDCIELRCDIASLRADIIDIKGQSGDNGKLGTLTAAVVEVADKVRSITSAAWWFLIVVVGGIGAAVVKLIIVGKAYGELETQTAANKSAIEAQHAELVQLRSALFTRLYPAFAPGKDTKP